MNQSNPPIPSFDDNELSLIDILNFVIDNWMIVAVFTLIGLGAAFLFINIVPKQFEASAQIKMAQFSSLNNNNNNNNINPLGINIEEPAALISRMTFPSSYNSETVQECGLAGEKDGYAILAKKVELSSQRSITNSVNLKFRSTSPELAMKCVQALFNLIKDSQKQLIAPYILAAKKQIVIERERLKQATSVIARADQSGLAVSAAYLATRDEIRYTLDQITGLQNIITQNESRASQLSAPIYVSDKPVFPPRGISLLIGILVGAFLGILIVLTRKWYRSNRK